MLNIKAWSRMLKQTTTTPEYDVNRIDSIRTQLNEDEYFVDILQIAAKFIDMEIALAGNT
jgi:anti-sigma28 factor (negative regulator of flagellin synthesis)